MPKQQQQQLQRVLVVILIKINRRLSAPSALSDHFQCRRTTFGHNCKPGLGELLLLYCCCPCCCCCWCFSFVRSVCFVCFAACCLSYIAVIINCIYVKPKRPSDRLCLCVCPFAGGFDSFNEVTAKVFTRFGCWSQKNKEVKILK